MRTLYVVTHPEVTHRGQDLVGGWFDCALTERGRRAAAAIADELERRVPVDAVVDVVTSDLKRTTETAEAIAGRFNVQPRPHQGLRETSDGQAQGETQAWLDEHLVQFPASGELMNDWDNIAGPETRLQFAARVYAALDDILTAAATHQVIVTHGSVARFVLARWVKMPLDSGAYVNSRLTSGGISVLREDDFFHNRLIINLNEVSHLVACRF